MKLWTIVKSNCASKLQLHGQLDGYDKMFLIVYPEILGFSLNQQEKIFSLKTT